MKDKVDLSSLKAQWHIGTLVRDVIKYTAEAAKNDIGQQEIAL